jgi:SAM-dependent methyltransferase
VNNESCLWCDGELHDILDLGSQPLANSLLKSKLEPEITYPLIFCQCIKCKLSQVMRFDYKPFGEHYPYYSSVNASYVKQCKELAERLIKQLNPKSVIEIGCNDGYMLENFKHLKHYGFEPSSGPAHVAISKGLNVNPENFNVKVMADLILAFNVIPHTPNLRQMIQDIKKSLNPGGVVVVEVQDLTNLLDNGYFDCIYHEHYSYFEFNTLVMCFAECGLSLINVEYINSHGGSIRAFFNHGIGVLNKESYADFSSLEQKAIETKCNMNDYLNNNTNIMGFGAPAKGNTMMNFCGIKNIDIEYIIDDTITKQGKFTPGSRIPIISRKEASEKKANSCIIFPWNFEQDIRNELVGFHYYDIVTPYDFHIYK